MESTLVLNASTEPLEIVSARRAIQLILGEKAVSVDDSNKVFRSADQDMPVPFVVQLLEQRNIKRNRSMWSTAGFSKRGVLVRDNYRCVYCGRKGTTIDHIIPQSLGGESSYENCVAACTGCNGKKAARTIDQLGWKIPSIEYRKVASPYYHLLFKSRRDTDQWQSWLTYVEMWSGDKRMQFA